MTETPTERIANNALTSLLVCMMAAMIGAAAQVNWTMLACCWLVWSICTIAFYGLVLLFVTKNLSAEEVADRARDGRMFRDVFFPLFAINWLELPGLIISALVYPFLFTVRRTQLNFRRVRFCKPSLR